ncbi:MAG TPA: MBOAT family O-acyltransferase [Stellaceae bacterium]|nr:MBOAT family O-acyltransferase [Stellaceae bacterium]
MSLSDPAFLGFFAVVFVLFYLLPGGTSRLVLLLSASLGFYVKLVGGYTAVLLYVAAVAYVGGSALQRMAAGRSRGVIFIAALLAILAPLVVFKYLGFLADAAHIDLPGSLADLALPVGLSFFTFAATGYLIDVNLGLLEAERNPLRLGLFVTFFPLVTAGPIERGGRLLPQFDLNPRMSADRAFDGLRLIFIGLVLKVLFADTLAVPSAEVFGDPESALPLDKLVAMIFFAFDLYADFAGYSLIAIGCAKMLGIDVQPNFRQPFLSQGIPEFWRTWHMSLSFWVRDYLFMPLRAKWRRSGHRGMIAATLISFTILGIWHGAGWQFVIYGFAFGVLAVSSLYTLKYRDAAYARLGVPQAVVRVIRAVITFFLFALVLVLFRVNYLGDAWLFYRDIFSLDLLRNIWDGVGYALFRLGDAPELPIVTGYWADWFLIGAIVVGDILARNGVTLAKCGRSMQAVAYNLGFAAILYLWMSSSVAPPFLYYKF